MQDPTICRHRRDTRSKDTQGLKVKRGKIFHVNSNQNWTGVALLISDKIYIKIFRSQKRTVYNDKRSQFTKKSLIIYATKTVSVGRPAINLMGMIWEREALGAKVMSSHIHR